jgi:hypothetical protein
MCRRYNTQGFGVCGNVGNVQAGPENAAFWRRKDWLHSAHITISYIMAYMNLKNLNSMFQMVHEDGHIDAIELGKARSGCMTRTQNRCGVSGFSGDNPSWVHLSPLHNLRRDGRYASLSLTTMYYVGNWFINRRSCQR